MSSSDKDKSINSNDLPEDQVFSRKELFQQKQPQDTGNALNDGDDQNRGDHTTAGNQGEKASKDEGLNNEQSEATGGAYEGFENMEG